jgi:pectinesterase
MKIRLLMLLACAGSAVGYEQKACAVLEARRDAVDDTARIQQALNRCGPGKAVVLKGGEFHSKPLILPRAVTLWAVGLLQASSNPRDYEFEGGGCCKPFIYAYQAAFSGVTGAIDGGGVARVLISSYESQGFHVFKASLRNAADIHLAIFKTTGLRVEDVDIDSHSPGSQGILLSNTVDAKILGVNLIRVPKEAISLKASILGGTANVAFERTDIEGGLGISIGDDIYGSVRNVTFGHFGVYDAERGVSLNLKGKQGGQPQDIHFEDACMHNVAEPVRGVPAGGSIDLEYGDCPSGLDRAGDPKAPYWPPLDPPHRISRSLTVRPGESVQAAIDALADTGGDILIKPGTYREVVTIRKPHVHLHGEGDPAATTIVFNHGPSDGGTFASATVFVEADDVTIDHLTIANDLGAGHGQGVALAVTADRAIFRRLRLLGAQDTLFAASRYCYGDYGPCVAARQYFEDCYIEGNTDFIFGDSMAVFERCELHGVATGSVMYTAQSRHTAAQKDSGYVFDHCRLTGAPRDGAISLGRPWRPYATVVFLDSQIDAPVIAAGWSEWPRFGKPSLPTAYYAEHHSTGPGANPEAREPYSHQLTAVEAAEWRADRFLAGKDGWRPASPSAGVH